MIIDRHGAFLFNQTLTAAYEINRKNIGVAKLAIAKLFKLDSTIVNKKNKKQKTDK